MVFILAVVLLCIVVAFFFNADASDIQMDCQLLPRSFISISLFFALSCFLFVVVYSINVGAKKI